MKNPLQDIQSVEPQRYDGIDLDHLLLVSVDEIQNRGMPVTFENIVAASFMLFPKKFSLIGYPQWPDGKRVHDAIFHCTYKTKQWLAGKKKHGYSFTAKGLEELEKTRAWIDNTAQISKQAPSKTRRAEKLADHIKSAAAYTKYSSDDESSISKSDICALLQVTLDTPMEILQSNHNTLRASMEELGRIDLVTFLDWMAPRIPRLMGE
jgi:hypothetical protein